MVKDGSVVGISSLKFVIEDLKLHLCKVFDVIGLGEKENRETVADIWYIFNQIGCQDSRIDDLKRDLRVLTSVIDFIKKEVLKMAKMSKCSHFQEFWRSSYGGSIGNTTSPRL